jgi:hypothetical protein
MFTSAVARGGGPSDAAGGSWQGGLFSARLTEGAHEVPVVGTVTGTLFRTASQTLYPPRYASAGLMTSPVDYIIGGTPYLFYYQVLGGNAAFKGIDYDPLYLYPTGRGYSMPPSCSAPIMGPACGQAPGGGNENWYCLDGGDGGVENGYNTSWQATATTGGCDLATGCADQAAMAGLCAASASPADCLNSYIQYYGNKYFGSTNCRLEAVSFALGQQPCPYTYAFNSTNSSNSFELFPLGYYAYTISCLTQVGTATVPGADALGAARCVYAKPQGF